MSSNGPLRIFYAAYVRLPTEKAHGAQIMHTCTALARAGVSLKLAIPGRKSAIDEDPFEYYGVENNFELAALPVPDFLHMRRAGFLISATAFALRCAREVCRTKSDAVYTRDRSLALVFSIFLPRTLSLFFEVHGKEPMFLVRFLSLRAGFVAITDGVREMLLARGVRPEKIIVAHDGVEPKDFERVDSKESARKRLGLPQDKNIAMYVGRLDGWKGVDTLLKASELLSPGIMVAVIGGESSQVEALAPQYPKVSFLGYHVYRDLGRNLAAADVLVLPNTARDVTSLRYTSPLKLFGYMASGRPIVASDLPSVREVVSEQSAYLALPDDPAAMAAAIIEATDHPAESARKAQEAKRLVENYSWDARAATIKNFIINFNHG